MRHSIEYQGPYELNLDRVRKGARTYLKRDGSEAEFRGPAGINGLRFGLLQKAGGGGFVIARIQFGSIDLPLKRPIESAGIGPMGKRLTKVGALTLLDDARKSNPHLRAKLKRIAATVETAHGDD